MRLLRRPLSLACALLAGVSALLAGASVRAAEPPLNKWAATHLDEVDVDFGFQGEYFGTLATAGGGPSGDIGLQVIARGAGKFNAVEYPGGLPGVGYYGGEKSYL